MATSAMSTTTITSETSGMNRVYYGSESASAANDASQWLPT